MSDGLDGRHRDENGQIQRKRSDAKIGNLKPTYPALNQFPDNATLGDILQSTGADSMSDLLRQLREK